MIRDDGLSSLLLIFLCIYNFMLVFCEKWNIIEFEATNQYASKYFEYMI